MKKLTETELKTILKNHEYWIASYGEEGEKANLQGVDLRGIDLRGTYLRYADFRDADFRDADFRDANLRDADFRDANLRYADFRDADFRYADLGYADLRYADFRDANLRYADFRGANLSAASLCRVDLSNVKADHTTLGFLPVCPEGELVVWKKCQDDVLVKLLIPKDAKRSNATTRKCRANKAVVLDIIGADKGISGHDPGFIYRKGETVSVDDFDEDRWNECSTGIHFFLTKEEAEEY